MVSSNPKSDLFDPYRQSRVAATPEEIVRQNLLSLLCTELSFPKELIAVEKALSELPHLCHKSGIPNRRVDVVCFDQSMSPLLLVECKKGGMGADARAQALGYNHYVGAAFVALAGESGAKVISPQEMDFIPSFHELVEATCL